MPDLARPGTGLRREAGCAWETQELTDEHVTVRLVVLPPEGTKLPETRVKMFEESCQSLWMHFFLGWDEGGLEVDLDDAIVINYQFIWLSVIVSINGLSVFLMLLIVFSCYLRRNLAIPFEMTARQGNIKKHKAISNTNAFITRQIVSHSSFLLSFSPAILSPCAKEELERRLAKARYCRSTLTDENVGGTAPRMTFVERRMVLEVDNRTEEAWPGVGVGDMFIAFYIILLHMFWFGTWHYNAICSTWFSHTWEKKYRQILA